MTERSVRQPQPLASFWTQVRFMVRRDRVRVPVWVLSFVGLVAASAGSAVAVYSTQADLESYATVAQANAAFKALTGPGYGLDEPTSGALVMNEVALYTYVAVALMATFMLIRHTRAEEETDRAELVRAAPVGRHATLAAAVCWVGTISLLISLGNVAVVMALGLTVGGSVAFGAATLLTALVFIGVAAVAAQVASSARGALAFAGAVLGASFLVRAVADMGNQWLTWLSPLGVAQAIRPFAGERWWVLAPLALLSGGLLVTAVGLMGRRDLGAGLMAQRPGPERAGERLATPFALTARLQRASLAGWLAGIGTVAFCFGIVSDQAGELAENEAVAEMLAVAGGGSIIESFLATIMLMIALFVSGFTVASVLRARSEELGQRAAPVLAMPVDRRRWLGGHLSFTLAGSLALMVFGGLMTGVGHLIQTGDRNQVLPLLGSALSMFVALAVVATLTTALVGVHAERSIGAWGVVVFALVVGLLAQTLDMPQWIRNVSPFEHVPRLPAEPFDLFPVLVLSSVAGAFAAVAMVAIRRRDVG